MNKHLKVKGTKLGVGDLAAGPFTAIAGIDDLGTLPASEYDETEVTRIDQEDDCKQFSPTFFDAGSLECKLGFDPAVYAAQQAIFGQVKFFQVTFSDTSTLVFEGYLKKHGMESEGAGGEILVPATIRCIGTPTYTAAA